MFHEALAGMYLSIRYVHVHTCTLRVTCEVLFDLEQYTG